MGFFDKIGGFLKKTVGTVAKKVGRTIGSKLMGKGIDFLARQKNPIFKT